MSLFSSTALRYFAEVVRAGTLSAAAERLCIAPSAVSRQLGLLEEELGAPLFERRRGRRQQALTTAGEHLMSYVYELETESRRVRADIQSLKGLRRGHIRLGMAEGFVHCVVPGVLAAFNQAHPDIAFDVEVANTPRLMELIADGQLDLALGFNPPTLIDVQHLQELRLPRHVIVPAGHPLSDRTHLRLSDCAAYGMALPGGTLMAKALDEDMFAQAKIRPRAVLRSNSYELMQTAAMAGMALCLANAQLLPQAPSATGHRFIPLRDSRVKPTRITLSVQRDRHLPLAVTAFADALRQALAGLDAA